MVIKLKCRNRAAKALCTGVVLLGFTLPLQAQTASEYQIKSAYLYNFAKMSQWPADALPGPESTLVIGVFGGGDEFVNVLRATLAGKAVNGHGIEVRQLRSPEELKFCHLIFFRASEKNERSTIASLEKGSILLVGEDKDFLAQGGMINLVLANGKITYEVNSAALERAGIHYAATDAAANASPGSASTLTGGSRTLKTGTAPDYPAIVRQMDLKGTVQLQAVVRPDGSVKAVHIVGGHPMLAQAAVRAVMQWRYESAGKETVETVRINFGQ